MRNSEITGAGSGLPPSLLEKNVVGKRLLLAAVVICQCVLGVQPAQAAGVYVHVFPHTGEIRLRNKDLTPFSFIYYSIVSPAGGLSSSSGVWKSIADNYDVSGNGLIDPISNWTKITPAGSTTELVEGVFTGPGGTLAPTRSISLGYVWNTLAVPVPNFIVEVREPNNQLADVTVEYALDGDYVQDGIVDPFDYNFFWRPYFGSTSFLYADGNLDGVIDAADYVVWRDNFGKSIPGLALGSGAGSGGGAALVLVAAVPEPDGRLLLVLAFAPLLAWLARLR